MTDFQSFRNAVLEDDDLQEQVISIIKPQQQMVRLGDAQYKSPHQ